MISIDTMGLTKVNLVRSETRVGAGSLEGCVIALLHSVNGSSDLSKGRVSAHVFTDLNQVKDQTQQWRWGYNSIKSHQSLANPNYNLLIISFRA